MQYIDKVADVPVDMQRQVSTTQAAQDIEEVEDVSALTQSEVPNILDDDEDWLEQESKKRKLPMPAGRSLRKSRRRIGLRSVRRLGSAIFLKERPSS